LVVRASWRSGALGGQGLLEVRGSWRSRVLGGQGLLEGYGLLEVRASWRSWALGGQGLLEVRSVWRSGGEGDGQGCREVSGFISSVHTGIQRLSELEVPYS
jgi:hypothetical protein